GGFSLIGLPPLSGFYGKWYVLQGALEEQRYGLVAAIVLATLATAFYVFRWIERIFFAPAPEPSRLHADVGAHSATGVLLVASSVVMAAGIVLVGVFSESLIAAMIRPALPGNL